jgi:hypothetical protein
MSRWGMRQRGRDQSRAMRRAWLRSERAAGRGRSPGISSAGGLGVLSGGRRTCGHAARAADATGVPVANPFPGPALCPMGGGGELPGGPGTGGARSAAIGEHGTRSGRVRAGGQIVPERWASAQERDPDTGSGKTRSPARVVGLRVNTFATSAPTSFRDYPSHQRDEVRPIAPWRHHQKPKPLEWIPSRPFGGAALFA